MAEGVFDEDVFDSAVFETGEDDGDGGVFELAGIYPIIFRRRRH